MIILLGHDKGKNSHKLTYSRAFNNFNNYWNFSCRLPYKQGLKLRWFFRAGN